MSPSLPSHPGLSYREKFYNHHSTSCHLAPPHAPLPTPLYRYRIAVMATMALLYWKSKYKMPPAHCRYASLYSSLRLDFCLPPPLPWSFGLKSIAQSKLFLPCTENLLFTILLSRRLVTICGADLSVFTIKKKLVMFVR
jgi:hypothetical protein